MGPPAPWTSAATSASWRWTTRLLLFDECDDGDVLREWLPTTGAAHVLLTCRQPAWDPTLRVTPVPIGPLVREESVELLQRLNPDLAASGGVAQVAAELGDVPLALRLAGGFLYRYRGQVRPDSFLEHLRSRQLFDRATALGAEAESRSAGGPAGPGRPPHGRRRAQASPVWRAYALADRWLEQSDPAGRAALPLLARAACFTAGEPLPRELLLASTAEGGEAGLGVLLELGLLEPDGDDNLRLHPSVAELVRASRTDDEAQAAVEGATVEWTGGVNDAGESGARLLALPHLEGIAAAAAEHAEDEPTAALCFELGRALWAAGDLRRARANLERALEIRERVLGLSDHRTITTLSNQVNAQYFQFLYQQGASTTFYPDAKFRFFQAKGHVLVMQVGNQALCLHGDTGDRGAVPGVHACEEGWEHPDPRQREVL